MRYGLYVPRVCVSYRYDGMSAVEVQVFCAIGVPYAGVEAFDYFNIVKRIYVEQFHVFYGCYAGFSASGEFFIVK